MFGSASSVGQVENNTLPLFIIHGASDDLVPTDMAHDIYDAAGGKTELWIVPQAGHTDAMDNITEEFKERAGAFIDDVLDE